MATFKSIALNFKSRSRGFSLTELLVSIAIIGIMVALLIPVTDRNLRRNSLANDIDLLKAKVEEVRLMASANQQAGQVVYYAIHFPVEARDGYRIVKLNQDGPCSGEGVFTQEACQIERINWSSGVRGRLVGAGVGNDGASQDILLAFAVPSQRFTVPRLVNGVWRDGPPDPSFNLELRFGNETRFASVTLRGNTGRLDVAYIQEQD